MNRDDAAAGSLTHRTAWNAGVRSVGDVLGRLATLAWTIAVVRLLDQQEVGSLFYALNVMLIASAVPTWGFDAGLIHRASRETEALSRLNTEVMSLKTAIGVPAFLLAGGLAAVTRPSDQATVVLVLFLVAGFPEMWSHTARATASVRQSPLGVSAALVLQRLVTAAAILVVLVMQGGLVAVSAMFLFGTLVGWVAHARAVRALGVRPSLRLLSRGGIATLLRETWLVGCSGILLMLLFRADTLLLAAIDGDKAVAVYVVAYRLLETVLFVSHAINQSIFPVMSASVGGTRARKALEQGVALASFVYLPFAVVCLMEADRVIGLLFGETYADQSAPVLRWLGPAAILFSAAFFMSTALMSRERQLSLLVVAITAVSVNLTLNVVLIPLYSGIGAAVATTVSYAAQCLVSWLALRRAGHPVNLLRPVAESAVAALALACVLVVLRLPLLAELAIGGVVYIVLWVLLARRFAPVQVAAAQQLLHLRRGPR